MVWKLLSVVYKTSLHLFGYTVSQYFPWGLFIRWPHSQSWIFFTHTKCHISVLSSQNTVPHNRLGGAVELFHICWVSFFVLSKQAINLCMLWKSTSRIAYLVSSMLSVVVMLNYITPGSFKDLLMFLYWTEIYGKQWIQARADRISWIPDTQWHGL